MSVNLQKGQKVDLTKGGTGLQHVMIGLGWDEASKGAYFTRTEDIDCDAIAFLLDSSGQIASRDDVVYFNNLNHSSGCVIHQGDNLTGAGEGDDEQIMVDLSRLPSRYDRIVVLVSIYKATDRQQHFGMIRNAFIRLVNADNGQELCIYNLSENYEGIPAMVFGELYRRGGEWKFNAVGQPVRVWSVAQLAERYGLPRSVWKN